MKTRIALAAALVAVMGIGLANAAEKSYESETVMLRKVARADCEAGIWKTIRAQGVKHKATVHADRPDLFAVSIPYGLKFALMSCEGGYMRGEILESRFLN